MTWPSRKGPLLVIANWRAERSWPDHSESQMTAQGRSRKGFHLQSGSRRAERSRNPCCTKNKEGAVDTALNQVCIIGHGVSIDFLVGVEVA
eukprot:1942216-Rhodomonas_salina.1